MRRLEEVIACEDPEGRAYQVRLWREWREQRQLGGSREVAGPYLATVEGPEGPRQLDIVSSHDEFRFRDTGDVIRRVQTD